MRFINWGPVNGSTPQRGAVKPAPKYSHTVLPKSEKK